MARVQLPQPLDVWQSIKARVEAQDGLDPMKLHDGRVQGVTRRQTVAFEDDLLGPSCRPFIDGEYLIDNAQHSVVRRLDRFAAIDSSVAMKNLLQDLGVRHQPLPVTDELLQKSLGVSLMRMRRSDEVHRNV